VPLLVISGQMEVRMRTNLYARFLLRPDPLGGTFTELFLARLHTVPSDDTATLNKRQEAAARSTHAHAFAVHRIRKNRKRMGE
jgi:hypothetical protein